MKPENGDSPKKHVFLSRLSNNLMTTAMKIIYPFWFPLQTK